MKKYSVIKIIKAQKSLLSLSIIAVSVLGSGCTFRKSVHEYPDTANVSEEISNFERDLESSSDRQVDIFSPSQFNIAKDSLSDANKKHANGSNRADALHDVALGRDALNRAEEFSKRTKNLLSGVATARQAAVASGAQQNFTNDFNSADKDLMSLTKDMEGNSSIDVSQKIAPLQDAFLKVELKSIDKKLLGQSRQLIEQAIQEGAKRNAKQSLAIAQQKVTETEGFIAGNRHKTAESEAKSQETLAIAHELVQINRDAISTQKMSSEELVLLRQNDDKNMKIQQELQIQERIDKDSQLKNQKIRGENELRDTKQKNAQLLQLERDRNQKLTTQTEDMGATIAFDKKFEAARSGFNPNEAKVYRQGNSVVIRLQTLSFPSNQSSIRKSNLEVLDRVAKVVEEFPDSLMIVEGHSDSDGGRIWNNKLSKNRANFISAYLVSNASIPADHITTVGYGSNYPLATNKTSFGKSQNRRVDIVIRPPETQEK
jgi:OOP family OmpA-OmpF porin